MKYTFLILTVLLFCTHTIATKIYEIYSMKELKPYLTAPEGLLVVFDIDSTILKLDNAKETVPWFCNELTLLQKTGGQSRDELYKELLSKHSQRLYVEYSQQLINVPIELAEPITSEIISTLVKDDVPFLIETKRGFPHIDITNQQLNSVGILQKSSKRWDNISYKITEGLAQTAYYNDGILFAGLHNTKGDALRALLKNLQYKPKRLVAIDDQRDNLVSFETMAHAMGIDFIGLRYGFLDASTKKSAHHVFDPLNCGLAA